MKKNRSTRLGAVIRLALVLGVISLLPTASHFAYAQLANSTTVTVPGIPSELINQFGRDTRLDTWNSQNLSTVKGSQIQVTTPAPSGGPGTPIIPKFANGINTPRIVSEGDNSAVQIADDAVVHGFLDVHEGILNTDTYKLCPACAPERQPVTFYSPVSIEPRPSIGTELSVRGEITASHILVSGSQGIDSGRIFVIARPGQTHTLQGNVLMNGGAVTIDSPFTIGQAGGVSIIKGPINLVGGDLNAAANISVAGTTNLTGNLAANANISVAGTSALKGVTNIGDPLVAPAVGSSMLTVWEGTQPLHKTL